MVTDHTYTKINFKHTYVSAPIRLSKTPFVRAGLAAVLLLLRKERRLPPLFLDREHVFGGLNRPVGKMTKNEGEGRWFTVGKMTKNEGEGRWFTVGK